MNATSPEPSSGTERPPQTGVQRGTGVLPSKETIGKPDSSQRHFIRTWGRIGLYLFSFLLGVLLSFAFTIFLTERNGTNLLIVEFRGFSNNLTQDIRSIIAIVFFGAFGGLLYSLRERQMELPYISRNVLPATANKSSNNQSAAPIDKSYEGKLVNLGIAADSLVGIGGALGIFLILPIDKIDEIPLFKLLATAMIGGYGGRSLLDRALGNILQKQEELEKEQRKTEKQLKKQEEQSRKDSEAIRQLSRYLDLSLTLSPEEEKDLLKNIKIASREVRFGIIFKNTQSALYENRFRGSNPLAKDVIKNALKIFESLRDSDENKDNDRYPAHVAYAHMALGEWKEAIEQLDIAKIRLKNSQREDNIRDELVYESNQVICKLNFDRENITGNLSLLKDLNDKLKVLKDQFTEENNTLWDRVDELLSRPRSKSDIRKWIKENQSNREVSDWLKEQQMVL